MKFKNKLFNNRSSLLFKDNAKDYFCYLSFFIAWVYFIILLNPAGQALKGHDSAYHYLRVEALKYNIQNGNIFSGIDYFYFGGAGYAGFAYPDFFLYIPALLRAAGLGVGESMTVFLMLCCIFAYWFMFVFVKHISQSSVAGSLAAFLYVLSTYRIDNIIVRFALGEVQAFIFWPLILYGLYNFIFEDFKRPYILGAGFAGMLLSHTISTAMALILAVLMSLIFIKRIIKAPKKLITLAETAGVTASLTAFYWLPLLELLGACEIAVKEPVYDFFESVRSFTDLFMFKMRNNISGLMFPIFLLCVPRVFLIRRSSIRKSLSERETAVLKSADAMLILGIIFALLSTSVAPWKALYNLLGFIQFPWRFYGPATVLLIAAGTIYIFLISKYTGTLRAAAPIIMAAACLIAFIHADVKKVDRKPEINSEYYNSAANTRSVGNAEWLPLAARKNNAVDFVMSLGDNVLLNSNETIPAVRENGTLKFTLENNNAAAYARLPYIWYKGYTASDENGRALEVTMADNGVVQVDLSGASGIITVEHRPTAIKTAAYFISDISVAALSTIAVIRRKKISADK